MNLYTILASAKNELRRAKDHEQTIRAIVESPAQIFGKSADDRKRELAFLLTQNDSYKAALSELRDAEHAVDLAQAAIDQAEAERREREWSIRQRLADALNRKHIETDDGVPDWLADRETNYQAMRDFSGAMNESDMESDHDMQADRYSSGFDATRRRMVAQREMDELYPTK